MPEPTADSRVTLPAVHRGDPANDRETQPVPFDFVLNSGSKIRLATSGGIPEPSSRTVLTTPGVSLPAGDA